MFSYFVLVIVILLALSIYWLIAKREAGELDEAETTENLIQRQQRIKTENLRKVEAYFDTNEKVTNDDVQRLLDVSDATATNYLDELEKEGFIRQVGDTGSGVYYEKIDH